MTATTLERPATQPETAPPDGSPATPEGRWYEGLSPYATGGRGQVLVHEGPRTLGTLEHRLVRHSPDGFSWGYGGSGPSELALNLVYDATGEEPEPALYQAFKTRFVRQWPTDAGWQITQDTILAFVAEHGAP